MGYDGAFSPIFEFQGMTPHTVVLYHDRVMITNNQKNLSKLDRIQRVPFELDALPTLVAQSCSTHNDRTAIQWRRDGQLQRLSYCQLWERVESLASALIDKGYQPQDHIAIWSENRWEWVIAYLAIQHIGAVVIPLDALQKVHEIRYILTDADAKLIFTSSRFYDDLTQIIEEIPHDISIVTFDDGGDDLAFQQWLSQGQSGTLPDDIKPTFDSLAAIIYTSGTTGFSKGVMLTHRNIASNIVGFYQVVDFKPGDIFLSVLPLHHTFECSVGMLGPLIAGCAIHYARSFKSRELIADFRQGGITIMIGVPLLFEKLLAAIRKGIARLPWSKRLLLNGMLRVVKIIHRYFGANWGGWMFRSLRSKAGMGKIWLMISGGAALPSAIAESYNELGFQLMQGYGLTETSPVLATNSPGCVKHSTVGQAIPGVFLKIDNPDLEGIGEIMAKGDCIMKGYYRNPKATEEVFRDGWLITGDNGWLDDEGYLTITGRAKEIIVTASGKNINPEEVEATLNQNTYISESLVLGIPDKSGIGEDLGALIYPDYEAIDQYAESRETSMTPEEVEELIRTEVRTICHQFPDYMRIRKIKIHPEEFQRTSTRKIKRYLYHEHFLPITPSE